MASAGCPVPNMRREAVARLQVVRRQLGAAPRGPDPSLSSAPGVSGWVAIPHAALAAVGPVPARRYAVLDLYERADRMGYGWVSWTERELGDAWGVDRRQVRAILESLRQSGFLELERSDPGSRTPSRLRVAPANQRRHQLLHQTTDQSDDQSGSARGQQDARIAEPVPEPVSEPVPEPVSEPSRAEYARTSDQTRQTSSAPAVDAGAREEVIAHAMALQERDEPQHGAWQPRDRAALERHVVKGVAFDRLEALWTWSGVSEDPLVAGCRSGWRRWGSLLKGPHGEARLAAAWAWHLAGRPVDVARATGPPSRAGPNRFTVADLLNQGEPARLRETH